VEAVTITLNGVEVSGYPNMTILELAGELGVNIPTLCHDPNLTSTGACRLCLVEDERNGALLASCVTAITPGMTINTHSPRVVEHRKKILKLLLASHPDSCLVCDKGNRCDLRKLAAEMGVGFNEFLRIPQYDVIQEVNPFIERDLSKCIMCGKCIRADQELVVEGAIDYLHRGSLVKAATFDELPLEKSDCTFCGTCVAICPTGALMEKDRVYSGTATSTVTTVCPYCGCGCTLVLGVKDGKVVRAGPAVDSPVNPGTLCVRGSYGWDFINSRDRILMPLVKREGEFQETTWEEALDLVAAGFRKISGSSGPDSLAVLGSSRCTSEENYLLQKFARCVLGTNNIDNGSRLYSAASLAGLGASIGYAGTTGSFDVLEKASAIIVIGANPEISAPAVAYAVKRAVRYGDAELCIIDPRYTPLVPFARYWLKPEIGTDIALLNGLAKIIVEKRKFDVEFVSRMTDNYDAWVGSLESFSPDYVAGITGVSRRDIRQVAGLLAGAGTGAIVYGNGITQYDTGTDAVIAIANLAMLTGNAGRTGGIFALQRENNARGAGDMGALPDYLPGYLRVDDAANRRHFEDKWKCELPESPGCSALEMMERAQDGRIKGMFIVGENPAACFPQPDMVRQALSSLDFLVVADMFLSETAALADVVLPAAAFTEKEGTCTNFEGRVQRLHKVTEPAGGSQPDGEIILKLSEAMNAPMPYASPQDVMEKIEEMVPFYRHVHLGERERRETGLGDLDTDGPAARRLHKGLFPSGFGRFSPVAWQPPPPRPAEYPFTLIVGSVRYGFGSGGRSSRSARLSKYNIDAFLDISPPDARVLDIDDGDAVRVISSSGELTAPARIDAALSPGLLFASVSSPGVNANRLFSHALNNQTKAPAVKSCIVRLEKVEK
jgi:formate dehydrogenase alpha subunit